MFENIKKERCVIACSGGPDSMALLDYAYKADVDIVVAHINYHKRESSMRDQVLLEKYCEDKGIPLYIYHATEYSQGNFQNWARIVRYDFFKQILLKTNSSLVLTAHHKDDNLETYIMQKSRKGIVSHWGIQENAVLNEMRVVRPLLNYTKEELILYCDENKIPYGIDESNFEVIYQRNKVRKQLLEYSDIDKQKLLEEIKKENELSLKINKKIQAQLKEKLLLEELFNQDNVSLFLNAWIKEYAKQQLSLRQIEDIIKQLKSNKNIEIKLSKYVKLSKNYNTLEISEVLEVSYCYVLDKIKTLTTPYFEIKEQGEVIEAVTLKDSDFPIVIRNAQNGDAIALRFGTKKLSRWFIDRKIPQEDRKSWPVMVNSSGKVIFIPKIGCDYEHYSNNPTCFMIK